MLPKCVWQVATQGKPGVRSMMLMLRRPSLSSVLRNRRSISSSVRSTRRSLMTLLALAKISRSTIGSMQPSLLIHCSGGLYVRVWRSFHDRRLKNGTNHHSRPRLAWPRGHLCFVQLPGNNCLTLYFQETFKYPPDDGNLLRIARPDSDVIGREIFAVATVHHPLLIDPSRRQALVPAHIQPRRKACSRGEQIGTGLRIPSPTAPDCIRLPSLV